MGKYVHSIFSASSFAFMLFSLSLWIHGYFACDVTGYYRTEWPTTNHFILNNCSLTSCQGQFSVEISGLDRDLSSIQQVRAGRLILDEQRIATPPLSSWLTFSGPIHRNSSALEIISQSITGFSRYKLHDPSWTGGTITCPAWLPTLLLALLPAYRLSPRRRKSSPPDAAPTALALA